MDQFIKQVVSGDAHSECDQSKIIQLEIKKVACIRHSYSLENNCPAGDIVYNQLNMSSQ